ncbi:hypothetical protein T07_3346 [Trichinella nelsoni]|uniref:PiggyBac transposable element-derived protein domain-containing protein n=1 Tax=Trichinella nelsoni TaxID=6336 RepID=A0A0V0RV93_9BILA|nr:hypothetical protein T07_3346 [Trichinella nelsoni]
MGSRQPMSDETMVLSESEDTDIGNVVSETDNTVDEGKAVAWITWINDISVFLSKNDNSVAINNIVQNDRGIGIQRLRSLDRYTPNMKCRTVAYTTKQQQQKQQLKGCDKKLKSHLQAPALIQAEVVKKSLM